MDFIIFQSQLSNNKEMRHELSGLSGEKYAKFQLHRNPLAMAVIFRAFFENDLTRLFSEKFIYKNAQMLNE